MCVCGGVGVLVCGELCWCWSVVMVYGVGVVLCGAGCNVGVVCEVCWKDSVVFKNSNLREVT